MNSLPYKYYTCMYNIIKTFFISDILDKDTCEYNNEYINVLQCIYTNLLICLLTNNNSELIDNLDKDKISVHDFILDKMSKVDKKIFLKEHFENLEFDTKN